MVVKLPLKLDLQFFAEKTEPPAEPPKKEEESEEMPKWATSFLEQVKTTLQPKEPLKKETEPIIPVPTPPVRKEEDPQEPPAPKKKSFLDWLM